MLLSSAAASSELSASSASDLSFQAENSTSLFELCLQDGAAERRFRVVMEAPDDGLKESQALGVDPTRRGKDHI